MRLEIDNLKKCSIRWCRRNCRRHRQRRRACARRQLMTVELLACSEVLPAAVQILTCCFQKCCVTKAWGLARPYSGLDSTVSFQSCHRCDVDVVAAAAATAAALQAVEREKEKSDRKKVKKMEKGRWKKCQETGKKLLSLRWSEEKGIKRACGCACVQVCVHAWEREKWREKERGK